MKAPFVPGWPQRLSGTWSAGFSGDNVQLPLSSVSKGGWGGGGKPFVCE